MNSRIINNQWDTSTNEELGLDERLPLFRVGNILTSEIPKGIYQIKSRVKYNIQMILKAKTLLAFILANLLLAVLLFSI